MTTILILLVFFISLEIFESNWQKAETFYGVIRNNYTVYNKNIFLFFILNPTFFYAIYLSMKFQNFGFLMSSIVILKFADISFRLFLMKKIQNDEEITSLVPLDIKYSFAIRYFNVILYPITFFLSLL
ncbi:MAG: hypothetical protein WBG69_04260 [Arcobacteraceae bacterium]